MNYSKYYKNKKSKTKENVKIERDRNIDNIESDAIDKAIYSLLLIALIIIPLFIKAHISEFISPKFTLLSSGFQADIFSYYKYIFLVIITIIIGILFIYKVMFLQHNIQKSKINLFLGILAVMVTLSAVLSPYKLLALHGMYNRHEGTVSLLCYLALFFVAANIRFSAKQIQGFLYSLYPFVIINMVLSLFAFNEKSLLEIGWINNLLLGSLPEGADVTGGEFGAAKLWGTTSNPNYISGIGAVLTVLFLTWAIFNKSKFRSLINIIIAVMSFVMILTSLSTSGFLTMIVLLPIILILVFFKEQKVKALVVLLAFVIMATSVYVPLANKNPRVWNETFGFVIKENPFVEPEASILSNLKSVVYSDDIANPSVKEQASSLKVSRFAIEKGLSDIFPPDKVYAEGNREELISFEIPTLPSPGTSAGSGRAYIWDKTFETAMEHPIFGYGLDAFTYIFPQDDIDKVAGLNTYNTIVDKPHNMYLGLFIGSGIIVILAFILLVGAVLFKGVQDVWKRQTSQQENVVMLALFAASIAYLVQGLVNDSVIGSAVIFWILLGVLVSIMNNDKVAGE